MKRQGLIITIRELTELKNDLIKQMKTNKIPKKQMDLIKWQINIVNKEGLSDTWRIEHLGKMK